MTLAIMRGLTAHATLCPRCGARLAPAPSGLRCPRLSSCGRGGLVENRDTILYANAATAFRSLEAALVARA
ncbi:MAG TPA: hypothetical protein VNX21_06880 [Candidatus Thermoplasmatota archaeon]|nr:hypothetical protein [Candidatus Thermoplasmatota archaeon]